jgi:hypothetical protein
MDSISRRTVVFAMAAPFLAGRSGVAQASVWAPPLPSGLVHVGSADMRAWALAASRSRPADMAAREAFIKRKALTAYTRPGVSKANRRLAAELIASRGGVPLQEFLDRPTPGGVGYGVMFNPEFLDAWKSGTSLVFTIICPYRPGGNVDTWLYLTAGNRAALGVEAFISYFAQAEPFFKVYDWAQASTNPWVLEIPLSFLSRYTVGDGSARSERMLTIWNSTYSIGGLLYRNEVYLYNHSSQGWDLFYQSDYGADEAQQRSHFVNWWGPIVETFQPIYTDTNPMGYKKTLMAHADQFGQWANWALLKPSQSFIRNDSYGFDVRNIASNFAFTVIS